MTPAKFILTIIFGFIYSNCISQSWVPADSAKPAAADTTAFHPVEKEAYFATGDAGWRSFLEKNLNPDVPTNRKAPVGTYNVIIQFVVDTKGKLAEFKALSNFGYGMEEEVIRILRKSPDWVPAKIDGKPVKVYRKQPVLFMVSTKPNGKRNKE